MSGGVYPAITLWQPWASLVAAGAKRFEFRSWPAPTHLVGRRVAIHAGARAVRGRELIDLAAKLRGATAAETGLAPGPALDLLDRILGGEASLPLSSVLCLATLGRPIRDAELAERLGTAWVNDSDRDEHSNWGWPLNDIEVLFPYVPARGAQGWWQWKRING